MNIFLTGGSGVLGGRLLPTLLARGHEVGALARSEQAAEAVAALGAQPVRGDLGDIEALRAGARGVQAVIHCASRQESGGPLSDYLEDNVAGTRRLLAAARGAGVDRFLYIGAAMCLLGNGRPIVSADETWPLGESRFSGYALSKTLADHAVRDAGDSRFATVVLRPAWIWGTADDPHAAAVVSAVRAGRMRLIDSGRHRIVTSHVDNVVAAIHLALESGTPGSAYYVFDDDDITIRDFLTGLLAAHGLDLPDATIPRPVAWAIATMLDRAWALLRRPGMPPISRLMVAVNGGPFLVSDHLARTELDYHPAITRARGLELLATDTKRAVAG